jgi:hypothetical protein
MAEKIMEGAGLVATRDRAVSCLSAAVRWKPPPSGFYKINWDAGVDKQKGKLGIGFIVRDSQGKVYAACGQLFNGVKSGAGSC